MRPIKRAMHFDFHTMPGVHNFGQGFDAEKFAEQLASAKVKYINFFAKCNIGFAYYPTEVGIRYPGLTSDMLGDVIRECHKRDIGVSAYFNGALDHENARLHRDWCVVNEDGRVIGEDKLDNFCRVMCYNTAYRGYLLAMIREVAQKYDIDGLFIDCMCTRPCYGTECVEGMKAKGMDPLDREDVIEYSRQSYLSLVREIKEIAGDKHLFFNSWRDFLLVPGVKELCTHAEIECLPETWGFDFFAACAAYTRNLKKNYLYMTGRMRDWGDFGGLKSKVSMENDMWDALMQGCAFSVGDHLHPAEIIEPELMGMIGELYSDLEIYEKYTENAAYRADIGVLIDKNIQDEWYQGVSRMLYELKYCFDFIDQEMDFSKYALIIIPDNIRIDAAAAQKLSRHLAKGGKILSSGEGGLKTSLTLEQREARRVSYYINTGKPLIEIDDGLPLEKSAGAFALPDWGFDFECLDKNSQGYFRMPGAANSGFRWGMYQQGILMKPGRGDCLSGYIRPYFNRVWDGGHAYVYLPPDKETEYCAAAQNGSIIHICFKVFSAYCSHAIIAHKKLVNYCIERLLDRPSLVCGALPSSARVSLLDKEDYALLQVKTTFADAKWHNSVIEEHQALNGGLKVKVRGQYTGAETVLGEFKLELKDTRDGYAEVTLPDINGYVMIKLDKGV